MTEKLQKNEAQVQQLYKDWNNKWKETHKIMEVSSTIIVYDHLIIQSVFVHKIPI